MAHEQMYAWLEARPQESLGEARAIAPDGFPLLAASELAAEHEQISEMIGQAGHYKGSFKLKHLTDDASRTRMYHALLERIFAFEARLSPRGEDRQMESVFGYQPFPKSLRRLLEAGSCWSRSCCRR